MREKGLNEIVGKTKEHFFVNHWKLQLFKTPRIHCHISIIVQYKIKYLY